MGALVGLLAGVGLLLAWSAFWRAAPAAHSLADPVTGQASEPAAAPRRPGLRRLLEGAGLGDVRPSSFAALCAMTGSSALVLVLLATRTPPVALAFGLMGGYLPVAVVKGRARRRQREFAEVWPEAVDNLASAVRAGMALPEALSALAHRGPGPLRPAFAAFALDYQISGRFAESLDRLKQQLADPVGDRVVEGLRVAREVGGGDLGRLLRSLSGYLREDARTRAELQSRQAWTVNGARLAVAAPWLVLLLLSFQPEVIQRYSSPAGVTVLVAGAICCVVAYRLMMRIGRLPTERRILS